MANLRLIQNDGVTANEFYDITKMAKFRGVKIEWAANWRHEHRLGIHLIQPTAREIFESLNDAETHWSRQR